MTLEEVYQFYGNATKAADAVNVSRQTFHKWMRKGNIPLNQQKRYEKFSCGKLKSADEGIEYIINQDKYTFPLFRYYSETVGMSDVHSLSYIPGIKPRIIYYCPYNRQLKFSSFNADNLMQSTTLMDVNNKILYEGDIVRLKEKDVTLKKIYDYDVLSLINESDEFLIIGNIFEGKQDGY